MNTVECPKCSLRFEPDDVLSATRDEIFCPQCGNEFPVATDREDAETAAA